MNSIISKITPIILCGGLGTRFQEINSNLPKALYPIKSKPFIHNLFEQLINEGFNYTILSTGHLANLIEEKIGTKYKSLHIDYIREESPQGTGGAILNCINKVTTDFILVLNGDSILNDGFTSLLNKLENSILLANRVQQYDYTKLGQVIVKEGQVIRFEEKSQDIVSDYVNTGIYLIKKQDLLNIDKNGRPLSLERDLINNIIYKGLSYKITDNAILDIGTKGSLEFTLKNIS